MVAQLQPGHKEPAGAAPGLVGRVRNLQERVFGTVPLFDAVTFGTIRDALPGVELIALDCAILALMNTGALVREETLYRRGRRSLVSPTLRSFLSTTRSLTPLKGAFLAGAAFGRPHFLPHPGSLFSV